MRLTFRVAGKPVTQGSATAFIVGGKYKPQRAVVTSTNNETLKPWREAVRSTAVDAIAAQHWTTYEGAVSVILAFALPKPQSAPKTRRTFPIGKRSGDGDKLTRAVLDALTDAGVWNDDAQAIRLVVAKDYPGPDVGQTTPGVLVVVDTNPLEVSLPIPAAAVAALPAAAVDDLFTLADPF